MKQRCLTWHTRDNKYRSAQPQCRSAGGGQRANCQVCFNVAFAGEENSTKILLKSVPMNNPPRVRVSIAMFDRD